MRILIMGGTGAIGTPLVKQLCICNEVFVTSRKYHENKKNLYYIQGDARDENFLDLLLEGKYNVIVDFMIYSSDEFDNRVNKFLNNTKQYIFFSSSRCYANSDLPITEDSDRLLDVLDDKEFLMSDDYALAKAREENILKSSGKKNWTIVRPYITYNSQRLQLGPYEKEHWIYRALHNRTVVFPRDIANSITTITYGDDVANCIARLIGKDNALGECFTIATREYYTWMELLEWYFEIIQLRTGNSSSAIFVENSSVLQNIWDKFQIQYDRLYDRKFNIDKLDSVIGKYEFCPTYEGIEKCINDFIDDPHWGEISPKYEAWSDRQTKEHTSLDEFKKLSDKLKYIKWRYIKHP